CGRFAYLRFRLVGAASANSMQIDRAREPRILSKSWLHATAVACRGTGVPNRARDSDAPQGVGGDAGTPRVLGGNASSRRRSTITPETPSQTAPSDAELPSSTRVAPW